MDIDIIKRSMCMKRDNTERYDLSGMSSTVRLSSTLVRKIMCPEDVSVVVINLYRYLVLRR